MGFEGGLVGFEGGLVGFEGGPREKNGFKGGATPKQMKTKGGRAKKSGMKFS